MGSIGSSENDDKSVIKVATLNYSDILNSPYQFFEKKDQQQRLLSEKMDEFYRLYNVDMKKGFLNFDRKWQKGRFSPLYVPTCGIKNNLNLMSEKQFKQQWDNYRVENKEKLSQIYNDKTKQKKQKFQTQKFYLDNLRSFDLAIYRAILTSLYQDDDEKTQISTNFAKQQNSFQLNAARYKAHRKQKFRKVYLDEKGKIKKTIQALNKLQLDILFLQQASIQLISAIQKNTNQFRIVKSCKQDSNELQVKSVIIIREKKFPKVKNLIQENSRIINSKKCTRKLNKQEIESLNFNHATVVQVIYNLILICPHLKSGDKVMNRAQLEQMRSKCKLLKQRFPDCYIIIGGDLNSNEVKPFSCFVKDKSIKFNVVPDNVNDYTTYKQRTKLQAQYDKAQIEYLQAKDYIISDLKILQADVKTIEDITVCKCKVDTDGSQDKLQSNRLEFSQTKHGPVKNDKTSRLPTDSHPYDHFMVVAKIQLPNNGQLQHVTDKSYLFKNEPQKLKLDQYQSFANKLLIQKIQNKQVKDSNA